MVRSFVGLACVMAVVACSGPGGGSSDGGADGSGGDGGVGGPCTATAMPSTILPTFTGYSLSVVGQDAYYVEPTANNQRGAIRHVKLDGSGDAAIVDAPMSTILYGATAIGSDLYYFQEDDAGNSKIHMYHSPRATGGVGTQVGTDTYPGFGVNILGGGVAGLMVGQTFGIFAQRGTDLFVSDGTDISRVSSAGTKTVIATAPGGSGGLLWPALVGNTVFYKDGMGVLYTVSADATMASGVRVGTQTCGSGRTMWMGTYSGGFVCGELFGIDKIDAMGATKSHVIYTLMDKNPTQFNPTSIDGTTYYALPKEGQKDFPIYKMDVGSNSATPVVCAARDILAYALTPTDLVYVEASGNVSTVTISLKRLAR